MEEVWNLDGNFIAQQILNQVQYDDGNKKVFQFYLKDFPFLSFSYFFCVLVMMVFFMTFFSL